MEISIYYFPNAHIDLLHKIISEGAKEKGVIRCSIVKEIPRNDSSFTEIIFECSGTSDILILGMYLGYRELRDAIETIAMPKIKENIDNLIKKIEEPSKNWYNGN